MDFVRYMAVNLNLNIPKTLVLTILKLRNSAKVSIFREKVAQI